MRIGVPIPKWAACKEAAPCKLRIVLADCCRVTGKEQVAPKRASVRARKADSFFIRIPLLLL